MRNLRPFLLVAMLVGVSCIIPDTNIEVYSTQGCGDQYVASTAQAKGYNGIDEDMPIKTAEGEWIIHHWCLSPEQSVLMQYENSVLYQDILNEIIVTCQLRAIELELGMDNCSAVAAVAHSGECPGELEWCESDAMDDEIGAGLDMLPNST